MTDELTRIHGGSYSPETIPLAVDTDRFAFTEHPTAIRDELGLSTDRSF
jgi:hypothetical protein